MLDTDVVHRQSFDTVVSVSVVSDVITKKFFKRIFNVLLLLHKNFVSSQILWDVPPLPGEIAFHFRDF